jgi:catechol 2,3-dioxygenase-like lactoylglutathione lyase family enzyme
MITAGNVTVYVSDMDRAVAFYVNQLGLKLSHLKKRRPSQNSRLPLDR